MPRILQFTESTLYFIVYPVFIVLLLTAIFQSIISGNPLTANPDYFLLSENTSNLFSLYLAHFTHLDFNHYLYNTLGFLIFYGILIVLFLKTRIERRTIGIVSLLLLSIIPFSISSVILFVPEGIITGGHGYSALGCGFFGVLILLFPYFISSMKKLESSKIFVINLITLPIMLFGFIISGQVSNVDVGSTVAHITGFFYGYTTAWLIQAYQLSQFHKKQILAILICLLFVPIICMLGKYALGMIGLL